MNMKNRLLTVALLLLVGIACGTRLTDAFAQAQRTSPPATISDKRGESERERLAQAQQASFAPAERLAWREIQERIDRMSHGEEAKDLNAAMHFIADDYTLYTLPDKGSPGGKAINR